jgi:hypothetical protein
MNVILLLAAAAGPWVAATIWVVSRAGWRILSPSDAGALPSQAAQLRAFGGSTE